MTTHAVLDDDATQAYGPLVLAAGCGQWDEADYATQPYEPLALAGGCGQQGGGDNAIQLYGPLALSGGVVSKAEPTTQLSPMDL